MSGIVQTSLVLNSAALCGLEQGTKFLLASASSTAEDTNSLHPLRGLGVT